jgi:hypothetical protein
VRWFWAITEYVDPMLGIVTGGKVATFAEAKARLRTSWEAWKAKMEETP